MTDDHTSPSADVMAVTRDVGLTDDECAFLARYCVTIRDKWKRTASDAHHHKDIVRREKAFDQIAMLNDLAEKLERIGAAAALAEATSDDRSQP